jgi:hypothetical protein
VNSNTQQDVLPFFKLLRKETTFDWTDECKTALKHLKSALSQPPVLSRPEEGETLYLYLAVSSEAVSAVIMSALKINMISEIQDWRGPLIRYITSRELPSNTYERTKLK